MVLAVLVKGSRQSGSRELGARRLSRHLRYLEQDTLGPDEAPADRAFFTISEASVTRRWAMHAIPTHPAAQANYHRLVLALQGESLQDARALTREVLRRLSEHLGITICWVAVVHRHREPAHVHVVLAGAGTTAAGQKVAVKLGRAEYDLLQQWGETACQHTPVSEVMSC